MNLPTTKQVFPNSGGPGGEAAPPTPGLLLIFSDGRPVNAVLPLEPGGSLVIGRGHPSGLLREDVSMSRHHATVRFDGRAFRVRDMDSRNGTVVDGMTVAGEAAGETLRWLRAGSSFFLLCSDTRTFQPVAVAQVGDMVMGAALREVWSVIARFASNRTLLISGESGTGKELAARAFHAQGPRSRGPFIAVNCAAIPPELAERLLFGARRGAYSGATSDVGGYVQAADGGTLFLDEVAELDDKVQSKLLRVIEAREVLMLGASQHQKVDIAVCSASHKPLRTEVAHKRFREDLYYRLGRPEVHLPALRERLEEIPWLIERALRSSRPSGSPPKIEHSLVEACLARPWPGNVRELMVEIRVAAQSANAEGSDSVTDAHLGALAGTRFEGVDETARATAADDASIEELAIRDRKRVRSPSREEIVAALERTRGNVSGAARLLGTHRTQLRRLLSRYDLRTAQYATGADSESETGRASEAAEAEAEADNR